MLGRRVREIIERYYASVHLVAPAETLEDANRYLPDILEKRGLPAAPAFAILNRLQELVEFLSIDYFSAAEQTARSRLGRRDEDDWPIIALAIVLDARCGLKTRTFLGQASRPGRPKLSKSYCDFRTPNEPHTRHGIS